MSEIKTYYFLFGEIICKIYHEEEFEKVLDSCKKNADWLIFCYDPEVSTPDELVNTAMGWSEYAEISEDEYNLLMNLP